MEVADRAEKYNQELFDRRLEIQEEELDLLSETELRNMLLEEFKDSNLKDKFKEEIISDIIASNKEELIEQILDWYEGSEPEYYDRIANVYMND